MFNFSINHQPKYKNTGSYFQTDKVEEILTNFEVGKYLNISLYYCCGFTYWFDELLLLLIVISHEASETHLIDITPFRQIFIKSHIDQKI